MNQTWKSILSTFDLYEYFGALLSILEAFSESFGHFFCFDNLEFIFEKKIEKILENENTFQCLEAKCKAWEI